MPTLHRWLRFNLVGLLGAAVQLTSVLVLDRLLPHHALLASSLAVELALLHNVTWHLRFTWADRPASPSRIREIAGFHLTNGLISLAGTLTLVHLLLRRTHLPVLAANGIAILACSLLNFLVSDVWVFASEPAGCAPGPGLCSARAARDRPRMPARIAR